MFLKSCSHVLKHIAGDWILFSTYRVVELLNQLSEPISQLVDDFLRREEFDRQRIHGCLGYNSSYQPAGRSTHDHLTFGHVISDVGQSFVDRLKKVVNTI